MIYVALEPQKDEEGDLNNKESEFVLLGQTPTKFEEGGQAILDELQEVKLGSDKVPRPTFINRTCPKKKRRHTSDS